MMYKQHQIKSIRKGQKISSIRQSNNNYQSSSMINKAKEQQDKTNYINKIKQTTAEVLNGITNLKQLEDTARNFIAQNINNVGQYKDALIQAVSQVKNNIVANHNTNINKLKQSIQHYKENYEYYHDRAKENRKEGRDDSRYKEKYKAERTKIAETQKIIERMQNGERLDLNKVKRYIHDMGKYREKKVARQISKQNLKSKLNKTNSYIEERTKLTRPESVEKIKQRLNVNDKEARQINKIIRENINKRTEYTDKIKENTIKGFSYSDLELRQAGLTNEEIKEVRAVEKLSKHRKTSILDNFDIKPINIKKYGDKLLNAKTTKEVISLLNDASTINKNKREFNKLSKSDKQLVTNYQAIKSFRDELKGIKDINKIIEQHKQLSGMKDYTEQLKKTKTTKQTIDLLNSISLLTNSDLKNIKYLKGLSNTQIKNLLLKNDENIFKSIKATNKLLLAKETSNKAKLDTLLQKLNKQIKQNQIIERKMPNAPALNDAELRTIRVYVRNLKKKKQKITDSEYNNILNSLSDMLGTKELSKSIKKGYGNYRKTTGIKKLDEYKFLISKDMRAYIHILKDVMDIAKDSTKKTYAFLKLFGKLGVKVAKWGNRTAQDLYRETGQYIANKIKKLPKRQQQELFKKTKQNFRFIKTAKDLINFAIKNPEIVYTGAIVLAGMGLLNLRKTIAKNPKNILSELTSWYEIGAISDVAILGAKWGKAILSPFVLKNVKIVTKDATLKGTAKALMKLEGKNINLYSATPESVKKLFKGINLSKKAEETLIKDMLKNPARYIGKNLKIRTLKEIAKTKPQREMLEFMRKTKKGILTGSASLKAQLKQFRKIGDLDIIANDYKKFAKELVDYLNSKTLWGKLWKKKRYSFKVTKTKNIKVYDGKNEIADIIPFKIAREDLKIRAGKTLNKKLLRTIDGVKVLKVEPQLMKKLRMIRDTTKANRFQKEIKDVKLILSKIKQSMNKKEYSKVLKMLNEEKGVLRVKGSTKGMGLDRKYGWAKKFLPDLNLRRSSSTQIRSRLKKIGFSEAKIDKYINLYAPDHFYFAPDVIYQHFLFNKEGIVPKDATIIFAKKQPMSKYPAKIRSLVKKNIRGELTAREQGTLRTLLNEWIKKNPDKHYISEKTLADTFGEKEVLNSVYTRMFPKKTLFKREVWLPELQRFIRVQKVTIGFKDKSLIKKSVEFFKNKIKGKSTKQLIKEMKEWLKSLKKKTPKQKRITKHEFIKQQTKLIDDEINDIRKLKIPEKRKNEIIKGLRRKRRNINKLANRNTISRIVRGAIRTARRTARPRVAKKIRATSRSIKRVKRNPKRVTKRTAKRITKRVTKRAIKRPRAIRTARPTARTGKRIPIRTIKKPKTRPKPKPRLKLKRKKTKQTAKQTTKTYNVRVRIKGKNKTLRLGITRNRAIKKIAGMIDNTTSRSFELVEAGRTKQKDIKTPKIIKKFRLKKSKNSKVLTLVEKTKYTIDTRGEKKGLKLGKVIKRMRR